MRLEVGVPRATVAHDGARLRDGCTAFAQRHSSAPNACGFAELQVLPHFKASW
ncbi:MAG: hypothetical protein ACTHOU_01660 [Aureliella sp.]